MWFLVTLFFINFFLVILIAWSNSKNKEVKKRGVGFAKVCSLSPELQNVVGVSELARTEVFPSCTILILKFTSPIAIDSLFLPFYLVYRL